MKYTIVHNDLVQPGFYTKNFIIKYKKNNIYLDLDILTETLGTTLDKIYLQFDIINRIKGDIKNA